MNKRNIVKIIMTMSLLVLSIKSDLNAAVASERSKYQLGNVIVSASRIEEYVSETGSSVIVIPNKVLEQKKYKTVTDAIRTEAGISVVSNGVFGGTTSVFIRGSDSGHILIMLDGVRMYDPISTNATYDLSNLTIDNVEQIEIIKGPQSSLYGSDAMGGVINIITKKGKGDTSVFGSFEIASKSTYSENLGLFGSKGKANYSIEASRQDSDGISAARGGTEDDGYQRTSVNTKISYDVNDNLEMGAQALYVDAKYDLDDGKEEDDPNYWMNYENTFFSLFGNNLVNEIWDHEIKYSWLRNIRKYFDDPDSVDTLEYYRAWYKGWLQEIGWQHNINLGKFLNLGDNIENVITTGFEYNYEAGKEKSTYGDRAKISSETTGYYLQNKFGLNDKLFCTLAARIDNHSRFGTHTTGRGSVSYLLDNDIRLKGSYGTGFNAPSLYQLFSDYGDETLKAEKSWGYDLGAEKHFFDKKLSISGVYFHSRYSELIEYDSLKPNAKLTWWPYGMYVNRGSAKAAGIESELKYSPNEDITFGYSFTYTQAEDLENKYHLIRRPNNKHRISVSYTFLEDFNVNMDVTRNQKIYDTFVWGQAPGRLKDYTVVNMAGSYQANENVELYMRVDNIFDETYEEIKGYSNKPRFVHFGTKIKF